MERDLDHAKACVREKDPAKFDFNKPVSLGAYVLNSYDPDGKWYIWQLRDDWQRTTIRALRQAVPNTSLMSIPVRRTSG
jgi:hypothetical protein